MKGLRFGEGQVQVSPAQLRREGGFLHSASGSLGAPQLCATASVGPPEMDTVPRVVRSEKGHSQSHRYASLPIHSDQRSKAAGARSSCECGRVVRLVGVPELRPAAVWG